MASQSWERRNARARALGYRNYYDYRAHHYGKRPASEPAARGPSLRRLRGHAGAADITSLIRSGRVDMINVIQTNYDPPEFELNAVTNTGRTRVFALSTQRQMDKFAALIADLGPDAPLLVGSPRALAALRAGGTL